MTTHTQHPGRTPESDEAYVREVLDSAMAGTRPPLDLSRSAITRGRRLRTRRRLAVASTVAAAGALVAVAAPWLTPGDASQSRGSDLVATQPPAPDPATPHGWWDMPATDMVAATEAILPDGVRVTDPGPLEADTAEGGPATGWIDPVLEGATGAGRLNVSLYPAVDQVDVGDQTVVAPYGTCSAPDHASAEHCVELGPDGTGRVRIDVTTSDVDCTSQLRGTTDCVELRDEAGAVVGRRLTNTWGDTVMNEVVLRRDGGTVYAASANTLDGKWGADSPVSADRPPLTLDQLEDLVRNDVWVTGPGT